MLSLVSEASLLTTLSRKIQYVGFPAVVTNRLMLTHHCSFLAFYSTCPLCETLQRSCPILQVRIRPNVTGDPEKIT